MIILFEALLVAWTDVTANISKVLQVWKLMNIRFEVLLVT